MRQPPLPRTRRLTVIAQDPSVLDAEGRILTTELEIPAEDFSAGPRGYRVHVVDYDTSTDTLYAPKIYPEREDGVYVDPFKEAVGDGKIGELIHDPAFHAQNVYAIVMRTLARFEFALGRRVSWGFAGHQIYVAPHAFADANAFYSEADQALAFGYFYVPGKSGPRTPIFTCLSYDIVAHETAHAILDGLRERYTAPSSTEQAGFHEGFADIVALLSVLSLKDVVKTILLKLRPPSEPHVEVKANRIPADSLTRKNLEGSLLFGLADEMGSELSGIRGSALRRSVEIPRLDFTAKPKPTRYLDLPEFQEEHRCGELLVAAIMDAFLLVWLSRLKRYLDVNELTEIDVSIVAEEGAEAADQLLTIAIRGLDYMPPTDIRFSDYLSAMLTCDRETVPDDTRYGYREKLMDCFAAYGIKPASKADAGGFWRMSDDDFSYDRTHFEALLTDPNEVFRFIWDNREELDIEDASDYLGRAYFKVQSVRPCIRLGPDGFTIRETVAEYVQMATLRFDELNEVGVTGINADIPNDREITLYGSGTLIFDEYARLKYHVKNSIFSQTNQGPRIEHLWRSGYISNPRYTENLFGRMHLQRVLASSPNQSEAF